MDVHDLMKRAQIAAPCSANWDKMTGDETVRLCGQCNLNVLNTIEMTDEEVLSVLNRIVAGEKTCIRFYRRTDGTFLTRDCPVGLERLRYRLYRVAAFISGGLSLLLCLAANAAPGSSGKPAKKPLWHASIKSTTASQTAFKKAAAATTPLLRPARLGQVMIGGGGGFNPEITDLRPPPPSLQPASAASGPSLLQSIESSLTEDATESQVPAHVHVGHTFDQADLTKRSGIRKKYLKERGIVESRKPGE